MTYRQAFAQLLNGRKIRRRGRDWIHLDDYGHLVFDTGEFFGPSAADKEAVDWEVE